MGSSSRLLELDIDTPVGVRSITVQCADLSSFGNGLPTDLLVMAAFQGRHDPTPATLIAALDQAWPTRVAELARNAGIRCTEGLPWWYSKLDPVAGYRGVLCLEPFSVRSARSGAATPDAMSLLAERLVTAISALRALGLPMGSIALPLLATGRLRVEVSEALRTLIPRLVELIETSPEIRVVHLVELDSHKADAVAEALAELLEREPQPISKLVGVPALIQSALTALKMLAPHVGKKAQLAGVLTELCRLLESNETRTNQVITTSRRLAEALVQIFAPVAVTRHENLYSQINLLSTDRTFGVAPWVGAYLQVLRELGNAESHIIRPENATLRPGRVVATDLVICLSCVARLLEFAFEWLNKDAALP